MKLFTHYSRVNILASIMALVLGSIGYYFIIRTVLIRQLDDTLNVEEEEILNHVQQKDQLPEPSNYSDQQISYSPAAAPVERQYVNIVRPDPFHHNESRHFRQLIFSVRAGGQMYTASVSKSEEQTKELQKMIMLVTAGMILLLLGMLYVANRLLIGRLWRPFYQTLEGLRGFNLSSSDRLAYAPTSIKEFRSLQQTVEQMTEHIRKDYEMLKAFADNASHEMQTPLAIINSKLDLMIQDQGLGEQHHRQLQAMYDAVSRLRHLNQSLLLLTKIENHQFGQAEPVTLASLLEKKLAQMEDLIKGRHITVTADLQPFQLRMNAYLADILLGNLLSNAIRHNYDNGTIDIRLQQDMLLMSNTGVPLSFDPVTVFDRFTKSASSEGTGLGLAIVRQICDNYGFTPVYTNKEGCHTIQICFLSPVVCDLVRNV